MDNMKNITKTILHSFVIAVLAVAFCLPGVSFAKNLVAGDPTFPLEDFAIITDFDMELPGRFKVENGHICSRNGIIDAGGATENVRIPSGTPVNQADPNDCPWNVIATNGQIDCRKNAVLGDVRTDNLTKSGDCRTCSEGAALACPANPPFPSFTASANPLDDIVCTPTGTDILPGVYRDLIIEKVGSCNFKGGGEYVFRSINANVRSRYSLNFVDNPPLCDPSNPYIINVVEYVQFAEDGKINQNDVSPVFINVAGIDGTYADPSHANGCFKGLDPGNLPSAFCYRGDGTLNACRVFVPNGTVSIRGNIVSSVQVLSKHFNDIRGLTVGLSLPDADCCADKADCACVINFFNKLTGLPDVKAGDTLVIKGKDFNTNTVSKVIFMNTIPGTVDILNPLGDCEPSFTILDPTTIEATIPALLDCPAANYYVGITNGAVCVKREGLPLNVTP